MPRDDDQSLGDQQTYEGGAQPSIRRIAVWVISPRSAAVVSRRCLTSAA